MSYETVLAAFVKAFGPVHPIEESMCEASNVVGLFKELPTTVHFEGSYQLIGLEEMRETKPRDGCMPLLTMPELCKRVNTSTAESVLDGEGKLNTGEGYCVCFQAAYIRKALRVLKKPVIFFPIHDNKPLVIGRYEQPKTPLDQPTHAIYILIAPMILDPKVLEDELQVKKEKAG
jgi:hypothetical protein